MASTIWKGHLTFGLISVPVKLFAAARTESVSFNQIHAPCGGRIKMQTFCPTCNRTVERKELQKGYEVESGRYLIIDEADIEKMVPQSAKTLEVQSFVKLAEVDPVYFNASYYMVPDGAAGEKAYYLLVKALDEAGYAGLAKITMHQREHIVVVRPALGGLMLHTIYYADEVRKVEEYGHPEKVEVNAKELELAEMFINAMAAPFDASQVRDRYRDNVMEMIRAKAQGLEVKAPAAVPQAPIMDLMAALKASIEKSGAGEAGAASSPPAAATAPAAAAASSPPATATAPAAAAASSPPATATAPAAAAAAPSGATAAAGLPVTTVAAGPAVTAASSAAEPVAVGAAAATVPIGATAPGVAAEAVPASVPAAPTVPVAAPAETAPTSDAPATRARKKPPVRLTSASEAASDAIAQ